MASPRNWQKERSGQFYWYSNRSVRTGFPNRIGQPSSVGQSPSGQGIKKGKRRDQLFLQKSYSYDQRFWYKVILYSVNYYIMSLNDFFLKLKMASRHKGIYLKLCFAPLTAVPLFRFYPNLILTFSCRLNLQIATWKWIQTKFKIVLLPKFRFLNIHLIIWVNLFILK